MILKQIGSLLVLRLWLALQRQDGWLCIFLKEASGFMEEAIRDFPKQFGWKPKIENESRWRQSQKYILCGMGGSHLAGDIFQSVYPDSNLSVYQDYGLPIWQKVVLDNAFVIASSYTGNTEETLSTFQEAIQKGYSAAVLSTGGDLIEMAKKEGVSYIQMPNKGIQPRVALGFSFLALAKMMGREDVLKEAWSLTTRLNPDASRKSAQEIVKRLEGKVPVIYSSNRNRAVAYNWKIKFNETGKIPTFSNVFPELNHNEMNGFDITDSTKELARPFFFIFLRDAEDHPRIRKRMEVLERQFHDRGLPVMAIDLEGNSRLERIFSSLLLADWTAFGIAKHYGRDPEQVPMIEEFKKLIG